MGERFPYKEEVGGSSPSTPTGMDAWSRRTNVSMRTAKDTTWLSGPLIRQDETMRIAEGVNLTVHPAIKTDELFMAVVDNYIIGRDGPGECRHCSSKEIIEI